MDSLEYIDAYFKTDPLPEESLLFERKIAEDPDFAGQVAFYLAAMQTVKEEHAAEKKKRFREYYVQNKPSSSPSVLRRIWPYAAAASVLAVIVLGWFFLKPPSPDRLAEGYIRQHLEILGVTMGGREDPMQQALTLYNGGRLEEARTQFEKIARSDPSEYRAKEYAGIVSLRLSEYDKALNYFGQLETITGLHANPAIFYRALTLLKRNLPGDAVRAKQLLQQVVQNDLEGKETARDWLQKL